MEDKKKNRRRWNQDAQINVSQPQGLCFWIKWITCWYCINGGWTKFTAIKNSLDNVLEFEFKEDLKAFMKMFSFMRHASHYFIMLRRTVCKRWSKLNSGKILNKRWQVAKYQKKKILFKMCSPPHECFWFLWVFSSIKQSHLHRVKSPSKSVNSLRHSSRQYESSKLPRNGRDLMLHLDLSSDNI